jgi:hypothetical protein
MKRQARAGLLWTANWSSGLERDVHQLSGRFAVLETFRDDTERQRLYPRDRFIAAP